MPNLPPAGEDWTTWIIGSVVTALLTMWGIVVALAKFIENKYRSDIADLKQSVTALYTENKKCSEDRGTLFTEVAVLKERLCHVEKATNVDPKPPERI